MSDREPIKASTICIISSTILIVGFASLHIFSNSHATESELIICGVLMIASVLPFFFQKRDRRLWQYILVALIPIIYFPSIYYLIGTNTTFTKFNEFQSGFIFVSLLIILLEVASLFSLRQVKQLKIDKANKIAALTEGRESLSFTIPHGIEGISNLKPNCPIRLELHQSEIRMYEFESIHYLDNPKSASLQYSQIINADVVNVKERGPRYIEMLTPYFVITYLSKAGDEQQLSFRKSYFLGDFRLFTQALKARLTNNRPTQIHVEL